MAARGQVRPRRIVIEVDPLPPVDGLFPIRKVGRGIRSRALTIRENGSRAVEASRPSGSADAQDLAHGRSSSGRGLPRAKGAASAPLKPPQASASRHGVWLNQPPPLLERPSR